VLYAGISGNDNALRLSKTNKNKEKPIKTRKNQHNKGALQIKTCFSLSVFVFELLLSAKRF